VKLTDLPSKGRGFYVPPEDVWSVSEPDENGEVTAVVAFGGKVLRVKGRRVFDVPDAG
jgi:hypothetical protein